jgi:voltage-gated potassium channel
MRQPGLVSEQPVLSYAAMSESRDRQGLRSRTHRQLEPKAWTKSGLSPANKIIVLLILVATGVAIIETEPAVYGRYGREFEAAELLFGIAFLVEYLARLWSVAEDRGAGSTTARRLRFALSPAALLDLVVVLSSLVPMFGLNAAALRLIRLARIARLAKLGRMSSALRRLTLAVWLRRYELALTLALAIGVLILGATALYWIEGGLQPDKFGSIPRALWWAVVTLTTIGYGDVYPITAAGKVAASLLAVAGIGLIALPAGIMAGAMQEAMQRSSDKKSD